MGLRRFLGRGEDVPLEGKGGGQMRLGGGELDDLLGCRMAEGPLVEEDLEMACRGSASFRSIQHTGEGRLRLEKRHVLV